MSSTLEVADVFRRFGPAYRQAYGEQLSLEQLRARRWGGRSRPWPIWDGMPTGWRCPMIASWASKRTRLPFAIAIEKRTIGSNT